MEYVSYFFMAVGYGFLVYALTMLCGQRMEIIEDKYESYEDAPKAVTALYVICRLLSYPLTFLYMFTIIPALLGEIIKLLHRRSNEMYEKEIRELKYQLIMHGGTPSDYPDDYMGG